MPAELRGRRMLRSCDQCKARKVKCSGQPGPCDGCVRRKKECRFSRMKIPRRPHANLDLISSPPRDEETKRPAVSGSSTEAGANVCWNHHSTEAVDVEADHINQQAQLPELYVDRLLAHARSPERLGHDKLESVKRNDLFRGYSLTFFSDARLQQISMRVRNNKIKDLVRRISTFIASRMQPHKAVSSGTLREPRGYVQEDAFLNAAEAAAYIRIFFEKVHPFCPFLDRNDFESMACSPQLPALLAKNKAWSALYYAVLAMGCEVAGKGSFEPGKSKAWWLFSKSLTIFPDLIVIPDSLTILQALAVMSIFSLGLHCLGIEHAILSEAARRAQNLHLTDTGSANYRKIFWLLYVIDKITSFHVGRNSNFVDHNITYPVPAMPEAVFGGFDWFLTLVRYARLVSRAAASLFGAGFVGNPKTYYLVAIDQLNLELEQWRMSIPVEVRPGEPYRNNLIKGAFLRSTSLWTHLLYNSYRLALLRATLHLAADASGVVDRARQAETTRIMMQTARSTLELTVFIEVESYTPLWILGGIPLTSLFVVFDLVINNPRSPETRSNLALMDIASGHFSRIEYATNGNIPGSMISEFAHIAREYVNAVSLGSLQPTGPDYQPSSKPSSSGSTGSKEQAMQATGQTEFREGKRISSADVLPTQQPRQLGPSLMDSIIVQPPKPDVPQQPSAPSGSSPNTNADSDALAMMDTLYFPLAGTPTLDGDSGLPSGTDVMDLFNTYIPGIDPLFFGQWNGGGNLDQPRP